MVLLQVPEILADLMERVGTARYFWAAAAIALLIAFLYSLRRSQEFKRLTDRLRTLYRTAQIASSVLDSESVVAQTVASAHEIMGYPRVVVFMREDSHLIPTAWAGYRRRPPDFGFDHGIVGRVARTGRQAFVPRVSRDPDFVPLDGGTTSEIVYPLVLDNELTGILNVETVGGRLLDQADYELIGSLAAQLTVALSNAGRYERTREQAIRDGLTGLYNHAYFQERIREELARARRYSRQLALIMADLDNFKQINDRYGHTEGDRFLRLFAQIIKEQMREVDLPARYGGEEFAIILPEASAQDAANVAERLREQLTSKSLQVDGTMITVTASLGVAASPEHGSEPIDLIRSADEALYLAKHSGKNQVRTASERGQEIAT